MIHAKHKSSSPSAWKWNIVRHHLDNQAQKCQDRFRTREGFVRFVGVSPTRLKQLFDSPILFELKFLINLYPLGKSRLAISTRSGMKSSFFVHGNSRYRTGYSQKVLNVNASPPNRSM